MVFFSWFVQFNLPLATVIKTRKKENNEHVIKYARKSERIGGFNFNLAKFVKFCVWAPHSHKKNNNIYMCIYIKSFGHFIWLIVKGEIAFDQIIDSTCTTQSRTTTHLNHINKKETVPHQKPHARTHAHNLRAHLLLLQSSVHHSISLGLCHAWQTILE